MTDEDRVRITNQPLLYHTVIHLLKSSSHVIVAIWFLIRFSLGAYYAN